jgi:Nickel/cobalt transporter regulator
MILRQALGLVSLFATIGFAAALGSATAGPVASHGLVEKIQYDGYPPPVPRGYGGYPDPRSYRGDNYPDRPPGNYNGYPPPDNYGGYPPGTDYGSRDYRGPKWRPGQVLPPQLLDRVVYDWEERGLSRPPDGHEWVRVGLQFILVRLSDRRIARILNFD